jgi:hypothetical protein
MKQLTPFAVLITLMSLSSCGGGGGSSSSGGSTQTPTPPITTAPPLAKPGVLAISALPKLEPFPATKQDYVNVANDAFNMVFSAGARGQMTTFRWHELEPQSGAYDSQKFDDLNAAIAKAQSQSMTQYIGLQVINTTTREMPDELKSLAFDDPAVLVAFHGLLDRAITPNHGKIAYLSIGNEVDAYLRAHPGEWSHYQAFYEDALRYAHTLDATLKVGVTVTADGALTQSPAEVQSLNTKSDVLILTYYPITFGSDGSVTVRDPSAPSSDIPLMVALAGARPLVVQEIGYPAATLNGSSEQKQAAFVSNVFAAWRSSQLKIPFVNFFVLHDFTQTMCDEFGAYYGLPNSASFKAYLCSLGLRQADGTPRQAWATLINEAAQSNLP